MSNLQDAAEHIGEVLKRVKKEHLKRAYKITEWCVKFSSHCFPISIYSNCTWQPWVFAIIFKEHVILQQDPLIHQTS